MFKKLIKKSSIPGGYTGKTSAKIISVATATGAVLLFVGGYNLISKLNNRPQHENPNNNYIGETTGASTDNLVTEPPIETDTSYETGFNETETTLPELQEPIIPTPDNPVEDMSVEFVEILAEITNILRQDISNAHGTSPDLTAYDVNFIKIDKNNSTVNFIGPVKINNVISYYSLMLNTPSDLQIYNLPTNTKEYAPLLHEALTNYETSKSAVNNYIEVSNSSEIIDKILQTRLDDLIANDPNSAEIKYLKEVLKDTSELELSIFLNDFINRNISFNVGVYTEKHTYVADTTCQTKGLTREAIKDAVEKSFESNPTFTVSQYPSIVIDEQIIAVDTNATLKEQTFGK